MVAAKLTTIRVEKPWGRHSLWPGFADPAPYGAAVGEIWFDAGEQEAELLVKYLFTSERLSIQVHPDDASAQAAGYPCGKDEAWLILAAEPDAVIALGTKSPMSLSDLRAACEDGSIIDKLHWQPVSAGDFIYSPARTIHAMGAGITAIEVQQALDLTYRLYDYGRPRELHLEEGLGVSDPVPFSPVFGGRSLNDCRAILTEGGKFVVERWTSGGSIDLSGRDGWLIPVAGRGLVDGIDWCAGECLMLHDQARITFDGEADILIAYPGSEALTA